MKIHDRISNILKNRHNGNLGMIFNQAPAYALYEGENYDETCKLVIQLLKKAALNNYSSMPIDALDLSGRFQNITKIDLKTTYPGLTLGLGYGHGGEGGENEFKMGFSFDPTTGLPVIPGSSVKGRLRSYFPGRYGNKEKRTEILEALVRLIRELSVENAEFQLPEEFKQDATRLKWIQNLELSIFGTTDGPSSSQVSKANQDVFFDAFPVHQQKNSFLAEDTLAPHAHPLRDPVPLRFLKILPDTTIRFQFLLNDEGGLSAHAKRLLFEKLLLEGGAGAKTTVGYGQFERITNTKPNASSQDPYEGCLTDLPPLRTVTISSTNERKTVVEPDENTEKSYVLKRDEYFGEYVRHVPGFPKRKLFKIEGREKPIEISYEADWDETQKAILNIQFKKGEPIRLSIVGRAPK